MSKKSNKEISKAMRKKFISGFTCFAKIDTIPFSEFESEWKKVGFSCSQNFSKLNIKKIVKNYNYF